MTSAFYVSLTSASSADSLRSFEMSGFVPSAENKFSKKFGFLIPFSSEFYLLSSLSPNISSSNNYRMSHLLISLISCSELAMYSFSCELVSIKFYI
jgi:hypothetical protein